MTNAKTTRPGGNWTEKDSERQGKVRVIYLPKGGNHNQQTQAIWAEILRLREKEPAIEWQDIAILVRNNNQLKTLQTLCETQKIPYSVSFNKKKPNNPLQTAPNCTSKRSLGCLRTATCRRRNQNITRTTTNRLPLARILPKSCFKISAMNTANI